MRPTRAGRSRARTSCAPFAKARAGEDLIGPPAEQERIGAPEHVAEVRERLVIEERRGPSAALESAAAILVRPAEPLHHPVERDMRDGRQLHGLVLLCWSR